MRDELRKILDENRPKLKSDQNIWNNLKNIITLSSISIGVYDKIRSNRTKLKELAYTTVNVHERHTHWQASESEMFILIVPMIREIQNGIKSLNDSINDEHHIELDIPKNVVQNLMREIKMVLMNSSDFTLLQTAFKTYIEYLNEGIDLLTDVFDRIDSYLIKSKFISYYLYSISKH